MVCKAGQLQLIQHFDYNDSKDVLYNLLKYMPSAQSEQGRTGS